MYNLEAISSFGEFLVLDDIADIGKFSTPYHPSIFHHWWAGYLITLFAQLGDIALTCYDLANQSAREEASNVSEEELRSFYAVYLTHLKMMELVEKHKTGGVAI